MPLWFEAEFTLLAASLQFSHCSALLHKSECKSWTALFGGNLLFHHTKKTSSLLFFKKYNSALSDSSPTRSNSMFYELWL